MLQAMARDVANLEREIEQLNVKHDQIATDISKAIEQLKAKQEDMERLLAKVPEQSAEPTTSTPTAGPRPAASSISACQPTLPTALFWEPLAWRRRHRPSARSRERKVDVAARSGKKSAYTKYWPALLWLRIGIRPRQHFPLGRRALDSSKRN